MTRNFLAPVLRRAAKRSRASAKTPDDEFLIRSRSSFAFINHLHNPLCYITNINPLNFPM